MLESKPGQGLRVLSFFSGGGGLDLGFDAAGFEIVRASDIDRPSCKTLAANRDSFFARTMDVCEEDIRTVAPAALPKDIDLIIGGPPCQSFSASGRRAGGAAGRLDNRGNLFRAYCDIVDFVRPKAFVFENVRGILSTNKGQDWEDIVAAFGGIGYKLSHRILDALDFGAPQQRERMFLVGRLDNTEFNFPRPTHGPDSDGKSPYLTAGNALRGVNNDEDVASLKLIDGKYAHLLAEVPPGHNYLHFTAKRGYPKPVFAYRSRFSDFLYKADPDQPIKTLIAKPGKYTGPLHWDNRYFTIKEYMRLQGFPDGYRFCGSRDEVIRQIGNSVSPKIGAQLALAVAQEVFGRNIGIPVMDAEERLSFDKRKSAKASKTRSLHARVAESQSDSIVHLFSPTDYTTELLAKGSRVEIEAKHRDGVTEINIFEDGAVGLFAAFDFEISKPAPLSKRASAAVEEVLTLRVTGAGSSDLMPQHIWNAVDDWVQRTSHYHSLFELYGHFTEPYPSFKVRNFRRYAHGPYATFMEFSANLAHCSTYLDKSVLRRLFADFEDWEDAPTIIESLRKIRFDVRAKETNVAIAKDKFLIAYPFTLPFRRQMNFSVRTLTEDELAA